MIRVPPIVVVEIGEMGAVGQVTQDRAHRTAVPGGIRPAKVCENMDSTARRNEGARMLGITTATSKVAWRSVPGSAKCWETRGELAVINRINLTQNRPKVLIRAIHSAFSPSRCWVIQDVSSPKA